MPSEASTHVRDFERRGPATRRVESESAELAVHETGDPTAPTVILVHGYPDTHGVWDEVVELLSARFHVVTFDTRGVGESTAPAGSDSYSLSRLAADIDAVAEATSPDRPVHLVGHDWGAFECWEAITGEPLELSGRAIASFTAIAGPRVDDRAGWVLRRLRPWPQGLAQIAEQARRSWYVAAIQLPVVPELVTSRAMERAWPGMMRRLEGIEPRPGHPAPTLARDATAGLALYRTNLRTRSLRSRPVPAEAPVQLIVPTKDRHISVGLFADADRWARRIWRRDMHAGHWVQRSHPAQVARAIGEFVDHAEGARESTALRRARWRRDRRPLEGRLAIVTGAGSGIGRATAIALTRAGADVICADIDEATAAETAALARAGSDSGSEAHSGSAKSEVDRRAWAVHLDVSDSVAMEQFAAAVEAEHGAPQILVNNAGIGMSGAFLDTTLADWERIIDVNLWGVIHGARLFARMMVDAGQEGHVINVASAAAFTPSRILSAYATTKAAVLMLSECMRAELAGSGIGVSAICPGIVDTNIVRTTHFVGVQAETERELQRFAARAYGRRGYPPERVADAILRAVRTDPAVVPVTPEARVMLTLSQLSPSVLRRLARLDPSRGKARSGSFSD